MYSSQKILEEIRIRPIILPSMTTGTATKRTKSGCWTCRLRRKKCNEGGPPCDNCEARGVHCHGYGPKPQWKDRGALEREEARKLQYQSGRARSFSKSSITAASALPATPKPPEGGMAAADGGNHDGSSNVRHGSELNGTQEEHQNNSDAAHFPTVNTGFDYLANAGAGMSPLMSDIDLSLDTHGMNPLDFEFVSTPSDCAADRASSDSTDSTSHLDWSQFPIFSPELPVSTPVALLPTLPVPPIPPGGIPAREAISAAVFPDFVTGQGLLLTESDQASGQRHGQGMAEGEKGIELMMFYIADLCSGGNSKGRRISEMGWLLLLFTRSPTFCYTTLSLTSYQRYLAHNADSASRDASFTDYQSYRSQALKHLSLILPSTTGSMVGGQVPKSSHSSLCEKLVCSVQLAHLEVCPFDPSPRFESRLTCGPIHHPRRQLAGIYRTVRITSTQLPACFWRTRRP